MEQRVIWAPTALAAVLFISFFGSASAQTSGGDVDPLGTAPSQCVDLKSTNLRYGATDEGTGGEVSLLQGFLQRGGYFNLEPTGRFYGLTLNAVKQFQTANSILYNGQPTGYVGPLTRARIKELSCGAATVAPTTTTTTIAPVTPTDASIPVFTLPSTGSTSVAPFYFPAGGAATLISAAIDQSSLTSTVTNPTIRGTASGVAYIIILVSGGGQSATAVAQVGAGGQWSGTVSGFPNGIYSVTIFSGLTAAPLAAGQLTVNTSGGTSGTGSTNPIASIDANSYAATSGGILVTLTGSAANLPVIAGDSVPRISVDYAPTNNLASVQTNPDVLVIDNRWSTTFFPVQTGTYRVRVYDVWPTVLAEATLTVTSVTVTIAPTSGTVTISPPTITLGDITNLTSNSATINASITSNGGATNVQFLGPAGSSDPSYQPPTVCDTSGGQFAVQQLSSIVLTPFSASAVNAPYTKQLTNSIYPLTTYYYCIIATNSAGSASTEVRSFTTPAPGTAAGTVTETTDTTVNFNFTTADYSVNPGSTIRLNWYQPTVSFVSCQASGDWSGSKQAPATGVTRSEDVQITASKTFTLTCTTATGASRTKTINVSVNQLSGTAPSVTTDAATDVRRLESGVIWAKLNGSVNPNGLATGAWFRYAQRSSGATQPTCQALEGGAGHKVGSVDRTGTANSAYSHSLYSLEADATYDYCAVAQNIGGKAYGQMRSFTTRLPSVTRGVATLSGSSLTLDATGVPNGSAATGWFRYHTNSITGSAGACIDTDAFGTKVPASGASLGSGSASVPFSATDIPAPAANQSVFYCPIVSNSSGKSYGEVSAYGAYGGSIVTTGSAEYNSNQTAVRLHGTIQRQGSSGPANIAFRYAKTDDMTVRTYVSSGSLQCGHLITRYPSGDPWIAPSYNSSGLANVSTPFLTLASGDYYYCLTSGDQVGGVIRQFTIQGQSTASAEPVPTLSGPQSCTIQAGDDRCLIAMDWSVQKSSLTGETETMLYMRALDAAGNPTEAYVPQWESRSADIGGTLPNHMVRPDFGKEFMLEVIYGGGTVFTSKRLTASCVTGTSWNATERKCLSTTATPTATITTYTSASSANTNSCTISVASCQMTAQWSIAAFSSARLYVAEINNGIEQSLTLLRDNISASGTENFTMQHNTGRRLYLEATPLSGVGSYSVQKIIGGCESGYTWNGMTRLCESNVSSVASFSTKFSAGNRVMVTGSTLNVRNGAGTTGTTVLGTQAVGTVGIIKSGVSGQGQQVGSNYWWNVDYELGVDGWSVEDYLTRIAAAISGSLSTSATAASTISGTATGLTHVRLETMLSNAGATSPHQTHTLAVTDNQWSYTFPAGSFAANQWYNANVYPCTPNLVCSNQLLASGVWRSN